MSEACLLLISVERLVIRNSPTELANSSIVVPDGFIHRYSSGLFVAASGSGPVSYSRRLTGTLARYVYIVFDTILSIDLQSPSRPRLGVLGGKAPTDITNP